MRLQQGGVTLFADRELAARPLLEVGKVVREPGVGVGRGDGRRTQGGATLRVGNQAWDLLTAVHDARPGLRQRPPDEQRAGQPRVEVRPRLGKYAGHLGEPMRRRRRQLGIGPEAVQEQREDAVEAGGDVGGGVASVRRPVAHHGSPAQLGDDQVPVDALLPGQLVVGQRFERTQALLVDDVAGVDRGVGELGKPLVIAGHPQHGGPRRVRVELGRQELGDQPVDRPVADRSGGV